MEAIEIYTKKSKDTNDNLNISDTIKYGIKRLMYYTLRSVTKIVRTYGTLIIITMNKPSIYI